MTSIGGVLAPIGFARALVSSILAQSTRAIIWPVVDAQGNQVQQANGQPASYGLTGYVPVVEEHTDDTIITDHPVEQGAAISDHAYKLPANLTLRLGWSTSAPGNNPFGLGLSVGSLNISLPTLSGFWSTGSDDVINSVYTQLLTLQANRTLLTIYTARRRYQNMLIQRISLQTDEKTEHALLVSVALREILLANTTVVSSPVNAAAQKDPESTTPTAPQGQQNLKPASLPVPPIPPTTLQA